MKVLNLQCSSGHGFEGWFGSEDDFQDQLGRGLVDCPLCGDPTVHKMPSAPRLNLAHASPPAPPAAKPQAAGGEVMAAPDAALQSAWLKMMRHVVANTEDVGPRFAEEARRIHYGETEERAIRGQASREQTEALIEEGIAVLPLPAALKNPQ